MNHATYARPELNVVGSVTELIGYLGTVKQCGPPENIAQPVAPAYDLDE